MKGTRLQIYLLVILFTNGLQAQISSTQQNTDSLRLTVEDSAYTDRKSNTQEKIIDNKSPILLSSTFSDKFTAPAYMFKPTPKKAVIYSAIFPGLGQIYNRKYWKLPILYGGFVGFTYAITWNNSYYRDSWEGIRI